jgi:valyl-tRNA synthetase
MHPDDERYAAYSHGQKIDLEWINGPITATIIKDDSIDKEFGSGVMTITPWHDAIDFDIAERNKLDKEPIIDDRGKLLPIAGEFSGMHITKARPLIVEKLKAKGLLVKIEENYLHNVATNSRGGGTIEPQIKEQWFIDVNKPFVLEHSKLTGIPSGATTTLKEIMRKAVENGDIEILPERFEKTYYQWIDNLRDWCISRQIWYGHRVPVWYRDKDIYCDINPPPGDGWVQDSDTLDTWFSSGLWTFSTLGWPDADAPDLRTFHPTALLETGYDILFFWVARMILMSGYHLGDVPFKTVYLHGLVRDAKGRKMSKSLGNIIDPLDMIEKYGADATRMSLIIGAGPGSDLNLSEDKIRAYKKFANKLWNISRFIIERTESADLSERPFLTPQDENAVKELDELVAYVTEHIASYKLHLAGEKLYHYTWHTLADIIIESRKDAIANGDQAASLSAMWTLRHILSQLLKLLHPFMPFITEEIWSSLPEGSRPLVVTSWPKS